MEVGSVISTLVYSSKVALFLAIEVCEFFFLSKWLGFLSDRLKVESPLAAYLY
jgi:hypothetical protein